MNNIDIICAVIENAGKPLTANEICDFSKEVTVKPINDPAAVSSTYSSQKNSSMKVYRYKSTEENNKPYRFWLFSKIDELVEKVIINQLAGQGGKRKTEEEIKDSIIKELERIDSTLSASPETQKAVFDRFKTYCDSEKCIMVNSKRRYLTMEGNKYKLSSKKSQQNSVNDGDNTLSDSPSDEIKEVTIDDLLEKDLHNVLASFVAQDQHFTCYTKTINAQGAERSRDESREWNYPDMVGISYPFGDLREKHDLQMDENSRELAGLLGTSSVVLFSFELKQVIDKGTLKQKYFQAVSNSSWANEGYLVAAEYKNLEALINEMRRLASAFGIGFIRLNLNDFTKSEVLIPARSKEELDWITIDKLVKEANNSGFKDFITSINANMTGRKSLGKVHNFDKRQYIKPLNQEELNKEFQKSILERKEK